MATKVQYHVNKVDGGPRGRIRQRARFDTLLRPLLKASAAGT